MVGGGLSIDGENARSLLHNEDANPKYTKDSLFQKLVTSSFWLGDQEIQKQFLDAGAEGVRDMLQWAEACGHSAFEFNPKACRWRTSGGAVKRSMKYGLEPVSYTHLDVYKRQIPTMPTKDKGTSSAV